MNYATQERLPFLWRMVALSALVFWLATNSASAQLPAAEAAHCEGCPDVLQRPYPHSGWWHNPNQPGTGMTIDVQNGVLAANYYGYRADGSAAWFQISGPLVRSGLEGVYWELESDLLEFANGQAINQEHAVPELIGSAGTIRIEFQARNLLTYQVNEGEPVMMTQFIFGATAEQSFAPDVDYSMPSHEESVTIYGYEFGEAAEAPVPWVITHRKDLDGEPIVWWGFGGQSSRILWGYTFPTIDDSAGIAINYDILFSDYDVPLHSIIAGFLSCGAGTELVKLFPDLRPSAQNASPICVVAMNIGNPGGVSRLYYLPIGNLGDRHFTGFSEDGWVIEGHRLLFD